MKYFLEDLEDHIGEIGGHHSDNDSTTEDGNHGIALHIFDNIGIQYGYVLDIGAFSYKGSNVTPLMDKYDIDGLLLDGSNKYKDEKITKVWLEPDTIVDILQSHNCPKNLDYISIDIDNMDYWVLQSVLEGGYSSNLIVLEFNPIFNNDESYTKKYKEKAKKTDGETALSSNYGASLHAFQKLLSNYGYRLIHVVLQNEHNQPSSNNAFFIKDEFDTDNLFQDGFTAINKVFTTPFVEAFKQKGNKSKFKTTDMNVVKDNLIKSFVEV